MREFLSILEELVMLDGAPGSEKSVRDFIINEISEYAQIHVDALGNIIAFKKGRESAPRKVMIDAHMDEVALIVTDITQDGLLRFSQVGGVSNRVLCGKRVKVNSMVGVIGAVPVHLLESSERDMLLDDSQLYIDIAASSKDEAQRIAEPGDPVCFLTEYEEIGDGMIKSKALDDRFGCAVLIYMIKHEQPYDLTFTFTVQEELGLRGAKTAAYSVRPDYAVVVEATTAADVSGVSRDMEVCSLGEGAVLSFMDRASVYDKELLSLAKRSAAENNIPYQIKRAVAGGNNAGAIIQSTVGVKTVAVSLPCRYLHSPVSLASKKDMHSVLMLVQNICEKLASN